MSRQYISTAERTDGQLHRSRIIIHKSWDWHYADFDTIEQLKFHANMLGFTYTLEKEEHSDRLGTYREYSLSHYIESPCNGGFWKLSDIPPNAKPFKALSNGSIVTCYFTNDGEIIHIYRPNPNAKEVYQPLDLKEHIAHTKTYGCY